MFTFLSIYAAQLWSASPTESLGIVLSGPQLDKSKVSSDKFSSQNEAESKGLETTIGALSFNVANGEWQGGWVNAANANPALRGTADSQNAVSSIQHFDSQMPLPPVSSRQPGNFRHSRILWIHLHGYGGTTICDMARSQGEKVARTQDNCNVMPDLCSTPKVFRMPCKKRASSLQYTFTAIERAVDDDDLACVGQSASNTGPTMLSGVMLRDPLAGIKSTWIGNELEKDVILSAMRTQTRPRNFQYHFCLPPFDTFQHFDNFAVRTLSGDYDVAPGTVTAWHLKRAKEVLEKMDVVLILEHLPDHLHQLHAAFGWDLRIEQPRRSHRHRIPKNALSPAEEAFLKQVNALDYELYEFGKELALQRTAKAKLRSVS